MSIGSKIKFFRELRGLTQKELGEKIGIQDYSSTRIAQYEYDMRTPKANYMLAIAKTLKVAPEALEADASDLNKVAQFFFELEREYGLTVKQTGSDKIVLYVDGSKTGVKVLNRMLSEWAEKNDALKQCAISQKDYDEWQYKYTV